MKAWLVREKDEFCATVVFAETRGKERVLAQSTATCEGVDFCDIEVHRAPNADKYYKEGKIEMDWSNPQDRIALVKDFYFTCEYAERAECEECPAQQFCDKYDVEGDN